MSLTEHALSGLQKLAESADFHRLSVEERAGIRALLAQLREAHA